MTNQNGYGVRRKRLRLGLHNVGFSIQQYVRIITDVLSRQLERLSPVFKVVREEVARYLNKLAEVGFTILSFLGLVWYYPLSILSRRVSPDKNS